MTSFEYSEFFSYRLYDPNATFRKDETKDSMIERILEFKDMINDTMEHSKTLQLEVAASPVLNWTDNLTDFNTDDEETDTTGEYVSESEFEPSRYEHENDDAENYYGEPDNDGSVEAKSDEAEPDEAESDEADSDEADSDEVDSDEAGSGEADTDEAN